MQADAACNLSEQSWAVRLSLRPFALQKWRYCRTGASSRMGRFTRAAVSARAMSNCHTQRRFPEYCIARPPNQAPKKPLIWCVSRVSPKSVAKYRVPKSLPTIPAVGGTVASHKGKAYGRNRGSMPAQADFSRKVV